MMIAYRYLLISATLLLGAGTYSPSSGFAHSEGTGDEYDIQTGMVKPNGGVFGNKPQEINRHSSKYYPLAFYRLGSKVDPSPSEFSRLTYSGSNELAKRSGREHSGDNWSNKNIVSSFGGKIPLEPNVVQRSVESPRTSRVETSMWISRGKKNKLNKPFSSEGNIKDNAAPGLDIPHRFELLDNCQYPECISYNSAPNLKRNSYATDLDEDDAIKHASENANSKNNVFPLHAPASHHMPFIPMEDRLWRLAFVKQVPDSMRSGPNLGEKLDRSLLSRVKNDPLWISRGKREDDDNKNFWVLRGKRRQAHMIKTILIN